MIKELQHELSKDYTQTRRFVGYSLSIKVSEAKFTSNVTWYSLGQSISKTIFLSPKRLQANFKSYVLLLLNYSYKSPKIDIRSGGQWTLPFTL